MKPINSAIALRSAILELESTQAIEEKILRQQFHIAYESMKPINLIKSTFKEAAASQEIKDKVFTTTVGLAAGFVSKKLFEGVSHSPLRKLLGTALMFGITQAVAKNPEAIKAVGKKIFNVMMTAKTQKRER